MRVLSASNVEGIHEPRCREPDVHILLPSLLQLKSISERFTKLATTTSSTSTPFSNGVGPGTSTAGSSSSGPKLELSANMHGSLKLSIATDALNINSEWTGLSNPELDPAQVEGGEEGVRTHPSTRMKELGSEEGWAKVRIDGRDWGRVLSVGRLGGRVIACEPPVSLLGVTQGLIWADLGFVNDHALILYVYLSNDDEGGDESVLTVCNHLLPLMAAADTVADSIISARTVLEQCLATVALSVMSDEAVLFAYRKSDLGTANVKGVNQRFVSSNTWLVNNLGVAYDVMSAMQR